MLFQSLSKQQITYSYTKSNYQPLKYIGDVLTSMHHTGWLNTQVNRKNVPMSTYKLFRLISIHLLGKSHERILFKCPQIFPQAIISLIL